MFVDLLSQNARSKMNYNERKYKLFAGNCSSPIIVALRFCIALADVDCFYVTHRRLLSVVNHHGSRIQGGHYTTYVYHMGLNSWIHIDDELVRTVRLESMLKHRPPTVPYLLYYRRIE